MRRAVICATALALACAGKPAGRPVSPMEEVAISDQLFDELFLDQAAFAAEDAASCVGDEGAMKLVYTSHDSRDAAFGALKVLRMRRAWWEGPDDSAMSLFWDWRWVFSSAAAAQEFINTEEYVEGLPEVEDAPAVASDSRAFCGLGWRGVAPGDSDESVFLACSYVFRVGNIVGQVFVAPGGCGDSADIALALRYAQKAAARIEQAQLGKTTR